MNRRGFINTSVIAAAGFLTGCAGKKSLPSKNSWKELPALNYPSIWDELKSKASDIFDTNRIDSVIGTFHVPSAVTYRSFFAWDSGWNIIANSLINTETAYRELETIFNVQRKTGHVPHEVLIPEMEATQPDRVLLYKAVGSQYDERKRSRMIDPPSFLIAAETLYNRSKDQRVLALLPAMKKCADYLTGPRDLFGDGLVSILHPWESGTDSSPVFDEPNNININNPMSPVKMILLYISLLNFNGKRDWDEKTLAEKNRFVFEDVGMNGIAAAGLISLSRLYAEAGEEDNALKYKNKAASMVEAMEELMWDDRDGFFYPRYDLNAPKISRRRTVTGMAPLLSGLVSSDKASRLIEEHLMSPDHFHGPWLVPFNSISEVENKIPLENMMLWRGKCIWANMNWIAAKCAANYGYDDLAEEITRATASMVLDRGFFEFYDPETGMGEGAPGFTWPALALDMLAENVA